MSELTDEQFVTIYLPKLSREDKERILINYKKDLELCDCLREKEGTGTYVYIEKIPKELMYHLRRAVEFSLNKK